jgi:hypothetical protein
MKKTIIQSATVLVVAIVLLIAARWIGSWGQNSQKPSPSQPTASSTQPTITPMVSCPASILSYTQTSQDIKLIGQRVVSYASDGHFMHPQVVIAKSDTSTSKFACGYLFIRAGTKTNGALQSWEDVYVNPNTFGGHLDKTNAFSAIDGNYYSEYYYSLNNIKYWPNSARKSLFSADWAALLNVSNQITFEIDLNTNDSTGFIDEVSIAYKCWDPATGLQNNGCQLTVQSSKNVQSQLP